MVPSIMRSSILLSETIKDGMIIVEYIGFEAILVDSLTKGLAPKV